MYNYTAPPLFFAYTSIYQAFYYHIPVGSIKNTLFQDIVGNSVNGIKPGKQKKECSHQLIFEPVFTFPELSITHVLANSPLTHAFFHTEMEKKKKIRHAGP